MILGKRPYKKNTDEQLIEWVQQADVSAFDEIYHRYSQRLLFYFFRMLGGDKEKAQDFLQDLFLKIIDKKNSPVQNVKAWIFTIAHNMCKNEYRNDKVRSLFDTSYDLDSFADHSANPKNFPEKTLENNLFETAINRALNELNESQRSTFILKFQEGLTVKEISQILDCSEGTIKSRLFNVTKKLAQKLKAFHPHKIEV
jgi:RNA polymerase sigma-70 factor (ECF subfamily)